MFDCIFIWLMPKVLFRPMEGDFENVTVIFENIHQQTPKIKLKLVIL